MTDDLEQPRVVEAATRRAWARLSFAAWLCLAIHLLAGIAMATVLRHGLGTNTDLPARMNFLVGHQAMWIAAWFSWNAAALTILYFYTCFVHAHMIDRKGGNGFLRFAVMLTVAAIAADLSAEAIEMGVLPGIARRAVTELHSGDTGSAVQQFLMLDRIAVMLTGYLANGLYTMSALLLILPTRHAYPGWTWGAGLVVGVSGIALSVAALIDSVPGMVWSNAVLVPAIILWQVGVAVTAGKRGRRM